MLTFWCITLEAFNYTRLKKNKHVSDLQVRGTFVESNVLMARENEAG